MIKVRILGTDHLHDVTKDVNINQTDTVATISPGPEYTAMVERSVVSNEFPLNKLKPNSQIEFVLTKPPFAPLSKLDVIHVDPKVMKDLTSNIQRTDFLTKDNNSFLYNSLKNEYQQVYQDSNTIANFENYMLRSNLHILSNTWEVNLESDRFDSKFTPDVLENTEPIRTFATAAAIGLAAVAPQDEYLYSPSTDWTPNLMQHTNFSIVQKEIKITTPPYIGNTLTVPINPRETGDLISNMYFKCTLPPNIEYTDRVGVALIDKAEIYFDGLLIQSYDSDWHTIYNELFLSAAETVGLVNMIGGTLTSTIPNILPTTTSPVNELIIPLRFFFCTQKDLYLPMCALNRQNVYIKLYFNKQSWFTDYDTPIELSDTSIIFDQIFLTHDEVKKYKQNNFTLTIPKVLKESDSPRNFTRGAVELQINANFKVSMMAWFIRGSETDYKTRYSYGYTSSLSKSYTSYVNWLGNTVYYIPVLDYTSIYINNVNITPNTTDDAYYTFKQPLDHGLSVPENEIYVYCFNDQPMKNLEKSGEFDFTKIDSKSTNLKIKFKDTFASQLVKKFQLTLYYYGHTDLVFSNGYGTLLEI
jgi:hypothetical protein